MSFADSFACICIFYFVISGTQEKKTFYLYYLAVDINIQLISTMYYSYMFSFFIKQGFNWDSSGQDGGWWNHLIKLVPDLADAGVTHVWLPPASNSLQNHSQGTLQKKKLRYQCNLTCYSKLPTLFSR